MGGSKKIQEFQPEARIPPRYWLFLRPVNP